MPLDPQKLGPREKIQKFGVQNLKPHELLAVLFSTGVKGQNVVDFSKNILKDYDIHRFANLTFEELIKIHGISTAKACTILAAIEFSKIALDKPSKKLLPVINSTVDAARLLAKIGKFKKEVLAVLYLNAANEVIHQEIISIGTLTRTFVHPREIFEVAIRQLSAYIIIAHNHPSGSLNISEFDQKMTDEITKAGQILGIEVLESLIITETEFVKV